MRIARNTKHGHKPRARAHDLYWIWGAMKQRCSNPKHIDFKYYGARGISVCKRWRESFSLFLEDMGDRPSESHSIDRIDTKWQL